MKTGRLKKIYLGSVADSALAVHVGIEEQFQTFNMINNLLAWLQKEEKRQSRK